MKGRRGGWRVISGKNQIRTRVQFVVVCLDSLGLTQRTNTKGPGHKAKKTTRESGEKRSHKGTPGHDAGAVVVSVAEEGVMRRRDSPGLIDDFMTLFTQVMMRRVRSPQIAGQDRHPLCPFKPVSSEIPSSD